MKNGNDNISNTENAVQVDEQVYRDVREQIQRLIADPVAHWEQGIEWFVLALHKNPVFAEKIVETLHLHAVQEKLQLEQRQVVELFYEQMQIAKVEGLQTRLSMLEQLCKMEFLSTEAKSYAFAFRGECYLVTGNDEEALTDFDYALTLNTQDAWIINKRGQTYLQMGRYQKAVLDFDRAIELGEEDVRNRGQAYLYAKQYQEALAIYDKAIALNPQDADIWCDKGKLFEELEQYEEALAAYDEAIRLNPEYSNTWYKKGILFEKLQRYEDALSNYNEAIKINPQSADVWYSKGIILGKLQRYEEALINYDQAIKLNPQHVDAWHNKGIALGKLRRYEEKHAAYSEVIRLKPQYTSKQSPSGGSTVSPDWISAELLDVDVVILLQGTNLFGDAVYSYLSLTGRKLKKMFARMAAGENFKPADFGTVLASGRGEPSEEIRDEMKEQYNMIDVPAPRSVAKSGTRTWVEKIKEARM